MSFHVSFSGQAAAAQEEEVQRLWSVMDCLREQGLLQRAQLTPADARLLGLPEGMGRIFARGDRDPGARQEPDSAAASTRKLSWEEGEGERPAQASAGSPEFRIRTPAGEGSPRLHLQGSSLLTRMLCSPSRAPPPQIPASTFLS